MCPANRVSGSFYSVTWRRSDTFRAVSTPTRPTTRALRTQGSEGNPAYTGGSGLPRFRQTRAVFGGDNCRELVRQLGPPGGDVEVVVYSGSSGFDMDSTWSLRVFTLNGLLSREIHLGCIDFRDPAATNGGVCSTLDRQCRRGAVPNGHLYRTLVRDGGLAKHICLAVIAYRKDCRRHQLAQSDSLTARPIDRHIHDQLLRAFARS